MRADIVAGLRYVLRNPFQRAVVMTATISNFVLAITGGTLATLLAARPTIAILMALMLAVPVLLHRSPLGRVRRVAELSSGDGVAAR